MTDQELIRAALLATSLGDGEFARLVVTRDASSVKRWKSGKSPIPQVAREQLHRLLALPPAKRGKLVGILRGS